MRQKFAPRQCGLAPFDGFDEAVFFLEVTRNNILHSLIELAALLGRSLRELRLQVGVEMNFPALKIRENRRSDKLRLGLRGISNLTYYETNPVMRQTRTGLASLVHRV